MDINRDDKRKVGYESRASTMGSRVNKLERVEGRGTMVPGRGMTVPNEGTKYPTIE